MSEWYRITKGQSAGEGKSLRRSSNTLAFAVASSSRVGRIRDMVSSTWSYLRRYKQMLYDDGSFSPSCSSADKHSFCYTFIMPLLNMCYSFQCIYRLWFFCISQTITTTAFRLLQLFGIPQDISDGNPRLVNFINWMFVIIWFILYPPKFMYLFIIFQSKRPTIIRTASHTTHQSNI